MAHKFRILIVDDEKTLCSVFKAGLLESGYDCETALNGKAALELIKSESFDMMITDIIMPGMDGFELTEQVKKIKPDIIVIIMTGFQQEESYERAIALGAADFIKKPFALNELAMRIERVLRDAKILAEIRSKQQEVRETSREMIEGVQEEAFKRIQQLEEDIIDLRKKIS